MKTVKQKNLKVLYQYFPLESFLLQYINLKFFKVTNAVSFHSISFFSCGALRMLRVGAIKETDK